MCSFNKTNDDDDDDTPRLRNFLSFNVYIWAYKKEHTSMPGVP